MNRRNFLKTLGLFAAFTGFRLSANSLNNPSFLHGVASGDPTDTNVILWSRVTTNSQSSIKVRYEVAEDKNFVNIFLKGQKFTGKRSDFTVKIDAKIPKKYRGKKIFYRFRSGNSISETGSTMTLPQDRNSFKVAVFSCSNFPSGYFNVYRDAANDQSIDLGIHVGDYIYEYKQGEYATEDAVKLGRVPIPDKEITTLIDYRLRHSQYKTDKDLQKIHSSMPFICAWDDHEVTNDSWKDGAENHQKNEGLFSERRANALKAYYEWMPVRPPRNKKNNWKRYKIGALLDIKLLETRLSARTKQIDLLNFIDESGIFNKDKFLKSLNNEKRELLGSRQISFIEKSIENNDAWNLYAQQVLLGSLKLPFIPDEIIDRLPSFQQFLKLVIREDLPFNFDAWDGYPAERKRLLKAAGSKTQKNIFVAGDTHNCWVSNIKDEESFRGVELGTPSVTSPGASENFAGLIPATDLEKAVVNKNKNLNWTNLSNRGYLTINFHPGFADAEFKGVNNIDSRDYSSMILKKFKILPGKEII